MSSKQTKRRYVKVLARLNVFSVTFSFFMPEMLLFSTLMSSFFCSCLHVLSEWSAAFSSQGRTHPVISAFSSPWSHGPLTKRTCGIWSSRVHSLTQPRHSSSVGVAKVIKGTINASRGSTSVCSCST